ncbi:MAG: hypothetical protein K4571_19150 [Deltaproteobacteria bacterium]
MHKTKSKTTVSITQKRLRLFLFVLCVVLLSGCSSVLQRACVEQRTVFDIGSATLKMKTAKVDQCRKTAIGMIQKKEVKVAFAENTEKRLLSRAIQDKGIEHLRTLKKLAQAEGTQRFAGTATAAFRDADNAAEFLAEIKDQTGISIRLISQHEEAILGYQAAAAHVKDPSEDMVVWDIGGKSMQMIVKDRNQNYRIYRGPLASISFKNQLLEEIHHRSAGGQASPNPIGSQNLNAALGIARNSAADVPDEIKRTICRAGAIIGIGGVHNQSVRKQTGQISAYRREDLMRVVQDKIELTDAQIGGPYAETDVSNLILVLGFMQKLDIEEVQFADVNLTDGILIDPSFW